MNQLKRPTRPTSDWKNKAHGYIDALEGYVNSLEERLKKIKDLAQRSALKSYSNGEHNLAVRILQDLGIKVPCCGESLDGGHAPDCENHPVNLEDRL